MRRSLCILALGTALGACSNPAPAGDQDEPTVSKTVAVDVHDGRAPPKSEDGEGSQPKVIPDDIPPVEAPEVGEPPTVQLVEAGAEPRSELRIAPAVGTVDRYEMTMRAHMMAGMLDTQPVRRDAPPLQVTIRVEVKSADAEKVGAELKIEKLEVLDSEGVDPGLQQAAKDSTADMEQRVVSIEYDTTNRQLVGVTEKDLEGLNPQVRGSLIGLTNMLVRADVPFPREAVGVGATWRTVESEEQQGVELRNTTDYELRSLDGKRAVIVMRTEQEPLTREFTPPGAPPDVTIRLDEFESEIRGEVTLDLDHLAPVRAQLKTSLKTQTEVMANEAPAAMTQVTRSEVLLRDLERTPKENGG